MIHEQDAQRFAQRWLDAWNARDLSEILDHYSEDIVFSSPFVERLMNEPSGTVHGREQLKEYFKRGLDGYPDLHFVLYKVLTGGNSIVVYYRSVNNLLGAEVMFFDDNGAVTEVYAHYCPAGQE